MRKSVRVSYLPLAAIELHLKPYWNTIYFKELKIYFRNNLLRSLFHNEVFSKPLTEDPVLITCNNTVDSSAKFVEDNVLTFSNDDLSKQINENFISYNTNKVQENDLSNEIGIYYSLI